MKKRLFNRIALLCAILSFAAGNMQAAVRTVNSNVTSTTEPGTLQYEIAQLQDGDTLTFDRTAVDTINLSLDSRSQLITISINKPVTILGNGITFTNIPPDEHMAALIEAKLQATWSLSGNSRIENVHFEMPLGASSCRVINCTFKPPFLPNSHSLGCGNLASIEGCIFLTKEDTQSFCTIGNATQSGTLMVYFTSCTFVNSVANRRTLVQQLSSTSNSYPPNKHITFTNCVVLDPGATENIPTITLYNIHSNGSNVFQGVIKPLSGGPTWAVQPSDAVLALDATEQPLTFDEGIYKVTSGGAAYRHLPANPNGTIDALANVSFPEKDLSGSEIDYLGGPTHSGAWQTVYGQENVVDGVVVTDIPVNFPDNLELFTDTTYYFLAAVLSENGDAKQEVTWECADSRVTITSSGTGNLTATIYAENIMEDTRITVKLTAADNGSDRQPFVKEYTVTFKPYVHVAGITLPDLPITFGYTKGIRATVAPADANWQELEWEVEDPAVATVTVHSGTDSITVKGLTEGTTTVTARAKDHRFLASGSMMVTVSRPDYSDGVFIVNEDWWGHRSGSVNFLYNEGRIDYEVFTHANHTPLYTLGSPAQYGAIYGGKFYIISKSIPSLVVTDARTLELHRGFANLGGEGRFFFGVDEHTGYVGTANGIRVVNLDELPNVPGDYMAGGRTYPKYAGSLPGASIASIQTGGSAFTGQATTMKRVGERIFALQQGLLHVITASSHQVEITLSDHSYITLTQSKDGYLWLGTSGTVPDGTLESDEAGATNYFVRLDPWTLERTIVPLPEGVKGTAPTFGAWQADAFQGSATENVIYWKGNDRVLFRYDIATNRVDTVLDVTGMPLLSDIPAPWTMYGTAFAVNQKTGELIVTVGTFIITGNPNHRNNWKILRVNPNGNRPRADAQGVIGNIIVEYPLEKQYWFPAMPVFPDKYLPEFTNVPFPESISLNGAHPVDSLGFGDKVIDEDNLSASIVTTVLDGYNKSLVNAFIWRDTLVVAARKTIPTGSPAESTVLSLKFNSNGNVITKDITVTVQPTAVAHLVTGVSLNRTAAEVKVGETLSLTATVAPSNADNKAVTWSSSQPLVASVSATGTVTALLAPGTAVITATTAEGGFTATCTVTTTSAAETPFVLDAHTLTLDIAQTAQLSLSQPQGYNVTWRSSNDNIAMVSSAGKVIGVAAGTAQIVVEDLSKNKYDVCTVTVRPSAIVENPFELNTHTLTLDMGQTSQLRLTAPENYNATWRSSNDNIAMVSSAGKVIGVAAGTAQIVVEDLSKNKYDVCTVTVRPTSVAYTVSLNHTALTMNAGERVSLTATVSPSDGQTVTWSASNRAVADVTSAGTVIALDAGNATVTATLPNGTSASCNIIVRDVSVEPEVSNIQSDGATLSFSKMSGVSFYLVHLYEIADGQRVPVIALQVNPDGTITFEIGLRASGNSIHLALKNLKASTRYEADIEVVREINGKAETVSVLHAAFTTDGPTGIETVAAEQVSVYYANGSLRLVNLEGYDCHIVAVSGQTLNIIRTVAPDETHVIRLAKGVYFLTAQKKGERKTFKFIVL